LGTRVAKRHAGVAIRMVFRQETEKMSSANLSPELQPHVLADQLANKIFVDGKLRAPVSGAHFMLVNPATAQPVVPVAEAGPSDIDMAVEAATRAQKKWAQIAPRERGKLVAACGRLLDAHVEELSRLVSLESGKALRT